ncbi:MAG: ATP-binding protein [Chloroflexia bacterium]
MGRRPGDRTVHRVRVAPEAAPGGSVRRLLDGVRILDAEEQMAPALVRYGGTVAALAVLTLALYPLRETISPLNIGLTYLVAAIGATTFAGQQAGILASVLGFVLFDYFLIHPYLTFAISQPKDLYALFVFLGVSTLISWLLSGAREQARQAQQRAEDISRLYELSQAITGAQSLDEVLPKIAGKVAEVFEAGACWILQPDGLGQLSVKAQAPPGARQPSRSELAMAQWSFGHSSDVSQGSTPAPQFQEERARNGGSDRGQQVAAFLPLRAADRTIGVLGVADKQNGRPFTAAERTALATFADQAALALERLRLLGEARRAEMLERADKLKSALMSAVSHDLRTPLASIMTSVTSLLEPDIEWDKETQQDFLQGIYDEARRLNALVGNLLDMSRIEGGALHPEKDWYSIGEVIESVVQRLEPNLGEHSVSVEIEDKLPLILLDFSKVDQVLTNVLENAIKYTPPDTSIVIGARQEGEKIEVRVDDTGPGVPSEDLPYIFDKFYRAGSGKRGTGFGLGLAISKGLIEAHGGRMWATNRVGGGLEVAFTLPLQGSGVGGMSASGGRSESVTERVPDPRSLVP